MNKCRKGGPKKLDIFHYDNLIIKYILCIAEIRLKKCTREIPSSFKKCGTLLCSSSISEGCSTAVVIL